MTITKKLTLGLSLIVATNLMGAKSAPESIGNLTYNKAYITCHDSKNKMIINDTVEIDNIGFDYTKFMPIVEQQSSSINCRIKGMIELPSDLAVDKVDLEVDKAIVALDNGTWSRMNIENIFNTKSVGRYFNVPVQQKGGTKYVNFEIGAVYLYPDRELGYMHPEVIVAFFKNSESYNVKLLKEAKKRNESTKSVQLDKFFIFERKKK